jgi:hypothetical protein
MNSIPVDDLQGQLITDNLKNAFLSKHPEIKNQRPNRQPLAFF